VVFIFSLLAVEVTAKPIIRAKIPNPASGGGALVPHREAAEGAPTGHQGVVVASIFLNWEFQPPQAC
jgi:hypothetical protein